jgi:divalent metal cation (Fe/Co/Zn/Cd) transporter
MESRPSFAFGAAMIVVAGLFFVFAKDIPSTGLAGNADPGPRALPLAMATVVAVGGLIELTRAVMFRRRSNRLTTSREASSSQPEVESSPSISYTNIGLLAGGVLSYIVALSWLGFQISTVIFTTAVLTWLGARWWSALISGIAIVAVVRILFVGLFHVQLPDGAFGLAF